MTWFPLAKSCSHPVNRGQLGNETWCLPIILTVEDMRFLHWCLLVSWDVTFCGSVSISRHFKDQNDSIYKICHLPSSSSFQGQDIYIYIHIYLIFVLFHFYFLFKLFTYFFSPSAIIFPTTSTLLGTYTDNTKSQGSNRWKCNTHSHKTAEINYTHLPVSTTDEENLSIWNSEAIKLKYRYLIFFLLLTVLCI